MTETPVGSLDNFEVLVVDDHNATLESLVDILALAGLSARSAATAAEAVARQAEGPIAVAVVDYQLPDGTGLELAARLKDTDPDLPVIVLTGNASLETAVAAVARVDDYLTKPVRAEAFLRVVRAAWDRRRLVVENRRLLVQLQEANATLEASVRERTLELKAEGERLAEAQRIARIGSWEWDLTSGTLTASAELKRLSGLDPDEPVERYEDLLVHVVPDDLLFAVGSVQDALERRASFAFELRIQPPGAEVSWVLVRGRVEVDADGTPVRLLGTTQDITERKEVEATLAHQALHDALTGLPNRALLLDRLEQALAQARRDRTRVAVLFLDVDRFKLINDSRGHPVGDDLLVGVADRLRAILRPTDTVARFGGDEFVMVCQDGGGFDVAMHVAERVSDTLRQPFRIDGDDMFLTVSIGIAVANGSESGSELLRDADAAMYRAKEHGRARCEFFDETMRIEAAARLELQTSLHWAIKRQEMGVFYQPVVDVVSGRPVGVEALVRWHHPTKGVVMPAEFIDVAEESGLIIPIGVSVLSEAARQCAAWRQAFDDPKFAVGVNLSVHHLRHPALLDHVREALADSGLEPSALCLELTESVLLEDVDRHIRTLLDLRSLGVRLAIDDFGTGFSSLTYLKRFPVDAVKIDRSFVAGLHIDASDTAIVRSVVELAHALSLQVVAEGVERPEQLEALRAMGCDTAQGFLFSRPQPTTALSAWLADRGTTRLTA
ncbi:MAG: EAL domain-containing protein [Actinomycetota bacterium]|jgi:diguanylate cyclase (GGDEF)-like protein